MPMFLLYVLRAHKEAEHLVQQIEVNCVVSRWCRAHTATSALWFSSVISAPLGISGALFGGRWMKRFYAKAILSQLLTIPNGK
jgi:hypothetical protein